MQQKHNILSLYGSSSQNNESYTSHNATPMASYISRFQVWLTLLLSIENTTKCPSWQPTPLKW